MLPNVIATSIITYLTGIHVLITLRDIYYLIHRVAPSRSFPSFLPSPCLTCCTILLPHLEVRDSIWGDDWSHCPFIRRSLSEVFHSCKANARRSVHSPRDHFIAILIISDRHDWRRTRSGAGGTATLAWSLFFLFFYCSPWLHGQQVIHRHFGFIYLETNYN